MSSCLGFIRKSLGHDQLTDKEIVAMTTDPDFKPTSKKPKSIVSVVICITRGLNRYKPVMWI